MTSPVPIGLIGCGAIAPTYIQNAKSTPDLLRIVACADLNADKAKATASEYAIPRTAGVLELIHDPEVEVILNLTTPDSHAEIALAAVHAGKSVYNEKPLTIRRRDARKILGIAEHQGLLIGCAPDTFLGAGLQTCRRAIDDDQIGAPIAATAFFLSRGPESWHPNPSFYYQRGGGPLFDMGPYYLTALVNLLGPIAKVSAAARTTFPTRTITSQPRHGETINVEVPTHIAGTLEFASGAIATLIHSFDIWHHSLPPIEIHGTQGSLQAPDPNTFAGPVRIRRHDDQSWRDLPLLPHLPTTNARGLGLADLCRALREGGKPRASGDLAYHILETMHSLLDSAESGERVTVASQPERSEPA